MKIIEVHQSVYTANDEIAAAVRGRNRSEGTVMVNVMASPGAGKTSVILRTAEQLGGRYRIGVMEADIEAAVDAERMEEAGLRTIQVHTGGECAMDAEMTMQALTEFPTDDLDLVFLENVGNLVCPAETDTGADLNVCILSVPEGDDKPLKYPLMFRVCGAVLINKTDTREYFPFDDAAVTRRIRQRNPKAEIFFVSAKTGEGIPAFADWLSEQAERIRAHAE